MMTEWQAQVARLYSAALELEPARRAAYLAVACGGDEALRREVESLLAYEAQSGGLLDRPRPELQSEASLSGRQIGHCRILSLLGRGGMGEVWLAEDEQLGRQVAVKLLPAEFTAQPERVRRFAQEARAASALNHPNIITIHEIGQTENTHYLVTEYIEGETLRQHLTQAPQQRLATSEALDIALQIAAALAAAHEAGITHRDIKPENVMLRRDGLVKVLDFGLAKLTERAKPAVEEAATEESSTAAGMILGTPRYMSPEQARGEKVEARSDIFSFGVVLYEMLAGRVPFAGQTTSETIAALLRDEPPPLAAETPHELARIVSKTLQKDRAERYQTTRELLTELKELKQRLEFQTQLGETVLRVPPLGGSGARRTPPPPEGGTLNTRRYGAAVIVLVALVIAALAGWYYFNRRPVLTKKDAILLADFENKTGEEFFDGMLKQGLEMQLQQSPVLGLFPERGVRQTLQLMGRSLDERVTVEIAQEICERKNLKAFIVGSLAPLGSHYVLTLTALNGQSGEVLAREQVEVESKEQILRALSRSAAQLREKLGESLSSIQQANKPLEDATTAKPEAFRFYAQGVQQAMNGRLLESIPFFKRAAEIDPDFAFAYGHLSVFYGISKRPTLAAENAAKAYALRERIGSESEKLRYIWRYHLFTSGDVDKALETALLLKQMYPQFAVFNDLANTYNPIGQAEQAITAARESIRLYPYFAPSHRNLGQALLRLNRFAEAKDSIAQALEQKLDMTEYHFFLYQIAFIEGDKAEMQRQLDWLPGNPEEYVAFDWQSGAAAFGGQWRKARELARRAIELTARGDTQEIAACYATEQALRGAVFGACQQAKAAAAQGLKLTRGRASLPRAALALALCGAAGQAQSLVDELNKRYAEDTLINSIWLPLIRAAIELQRGQAAQAIAHLQATARYEAAAEFWPQYLHGLAYLQLRQNAEAAAEFQKILAQRGQAPLSPLYPLAQLGLARATQSRKAYDDFLKLWKDADADLPVLHEAQKEAEQVK